MGHEKPNWETTLFLLCIHGTSALVQIKNYTTVWISLQDKMVPAQAIEFTWSEIIAIFLIDAMIKAVKKFK